MTPEGLSLSFSRPAAGRERGAHPRLAAGGRADGEPAAPSAPETAIVKRRNDAPPRGQVLDVTRTVSEVFERARSGNSSYLTRFGVKDALVVLNQNGAETSWQVPDFSIDLEHKNGRRSILVGQANFASSKGDWQLEFRAAQQIRKQSLGITALIENLVPSGLAGNFSSLGIAQGPRPGGERRNQCRAFQLGRVPVRRGQARPRIRADHAALGPGQPAAYRPGQSAMCATSRKRTWSRSPRRR